MTEVDSFTVERDGRVYRIGVHYDEMSNDPRQDYDHDATQFYVTNGGSGRRNEYINEFDGAAGAAFDRFADVYGTGDTEKMLRAFHVWAVVSGSPVRLFTGSAHGYSQGDYIEWFALVDTAVMERDGYGSTPQEVAEAEADEYSAYMFGDVFGVVAFLNNRQIEDGSLWGIVDRKGDYVREVATDIVDAHEKHLGYQGNCVGAGFVGVL